VYFLFLINYKLEYSRAYTTHEIHCIHSRFLFLNIVLERHHLPWAVLSLIISMKRNIM